MAGNNLKLGGQTYSASELSPLHKRVEEAHTDVQIEPELIEDHGGTGIVPRSTQTQYLKDRGNPEGMGIVEGLGAAIQQEWVMSWGYKGNVEEEFDPDFRMTEDLLKELGKDIPPEHWDYFDGVKSLAHAKRLRENLLDSLRAENDLNSMGGTGLALRITGAMLDPVGWGISAVGAAPGMTAMGAEKLTRLQRAIRAGTGAAGTNFAMEAALQNYRPDGEFSDAYWAAGLGFGMGTILGSLSKNAPEIATQMSRKGREMMQVAEKEVGVIPARDIADSAGAMKAGRDLTINEEAEFIDRAIERNEDLAPLTAFAQWRWDVVGKLKSSDNRLSRALGNVLAEDAVGNADASIATRIGVTETKERLRRNMENQFQTQYEKSFQRFFKDNRGSSWNLADRMRRRSEFSKMVSRYVREESDAIRGSYPQSVQEMGEHVRSLFKTYREMAHKPGTDEVGDAYGSVRGFEDISQFSDYYMPRMWDHRAVGDLVDKYGSNAVVDVFVAAIKRGSAGVDDELAERIGVKLFQTLQRVRSGAGVDGIRVLTSGDSAAIREFLEMNVPDLDPKLIDEFVDAHKASKKAGGPKEGKRRIQMDEKASFKLMNLKTREMEDVSIEDFFVNDIEQLFSGYNRHMSGWISLAQMRLRATDNGEILLDGVRTKSDWAKITDMVRALSPDGSAESDVQRLDFLFRQITGMPEPGELSTIAQYARMFRDFNFMRLMGQVGFAQVAEMGVLVSNLGVKTTLESIPAFRSFRRNAQTGKLEDELAEELDYITSPGTEWLRGEVHQKWDEWNSSPNVVTGRNAVLNKIDTAQQHGKRAVSALSGMAPVNALMQRWAARGFAMRWADMAQARKTGKPMRNKFSEARLRSLGLSDEMTERVIDEFNRHAKFTDRGTLQRMNIADWDPRVATAFENAAFRFGRRVIQENDPGQMAAFMGNWAARTILQFRTFMLGAYTKQTLHNLHMLGQSPQDAMITMGMLVGSSLAAGVAYTAQTHLQSIGRPDREKFLQERLSDEALMRASFQRAGWASVMPIIYDTGAQTFGQEPVFNYRSTGQPSSLLFGNPTAGYLDDFQSGVGGFVDSIIDGRKMSQQEIRAGVRLFPGQNLLPITMGLNAALDGSRPERAPK